MGSIEWWTPSRIETFLDLPEQKYIRDMYFERFYEDESNISLFYRYTNDKFSKTIENDNFEQLSLYISYIDLFLKTNNQLQTVRGYLEKWVGESETIAVISGGPGQGKTCLCEMAMCDFYKNGWLSGRVDNVFCFSLNPNGTNAFADNSFNFNSLLSWGRNRTDKEHIVRIEDCNNALVFLDGFNELQDYLPISNLKHFIETEIIPFQKKTDSHIIITVRTSDLDSEKITLSNGSDVKIHKLLPLTEEQQLSIINSYKSHAIPEKRSEISEYATKLGTHIIENNTWDFLKIPLILCLCIENLFIPSVASIYELVDDLIQNLIILNVKRHIHSELNSREILSRYENLAIHLFTSNEGVTTYEAFEVNKESLLPFICSLTTDTDTDISFTHKVFYQYFLASWVLTQLSNHDIDNNQLIKLSVKKIDSYTLNFINELYNHRKNDISNIKYQHIIDEIRHTNGILDSLMDGFINSKLNDRSKMIFCENYVWNIFSICSNIAHPINGSHFSTELFKMYNFSRVDLTGADLSHIDLSSTNFENAILSFSNLEGSNFSRAILSYADMRNAFLSNAILEEATLDGANLKGAYLFNTRLPAANLFNADLSGCRLDNSILNMANLAHAVLSHASLKKSSLVAADLSEAKLIGADLAKASLKSARLDAADLSNAHLERTNFEFASLNNTILSGIEYSKDFKSAYAEIINTDLSYSNYSNAIFENSDLSYSDFSNSTLLNTQFINADLSFVKFTNASLSGSIFKNVNLSCANFTNADLSSTRFTNTNTYWANFSGSDLRGALYTDVDFSWAQDSGSMFTFTKIDNKGIEYFIEQGVDLTRILLTQND